MYKKILDELNELAKTEKEIQIHEVLEKYDYKMLGNNSLRQLVYSFLKTNPTFKAYSLKEYNNSIDHVLLSENIYENTI